MTRLLAIAALVGCAASARADEKTTAETGYRQLWNRSAAYGLFSESGALPAFHLGVGRELPGLPLEARLAYDYGGASARAFGSQDAGLTVHEALLGARYYLRRGHYLEPTGELDVGFAAGNATLAGSTFQRGGWAFGALVSGLAGVDATLMDRGAGAVTISGALQVGYTLATALAFAPAATPGATPTTNAALGHLPLSGWTWQLSGVARF